MTKRPRLGFLGVGWIGLNRLRSVTESDLAKIAAIADAVPELVEKAAEFAPDAARMTSPTELLSEPLDGIVIATPSALHAEQAITALEKNVAVFCQKPLGRNAREVGAVVEAARAADRLLGVDLSYRFTAGMRKIRSLIQSGELGEVFHLELTFHNAYGPDKPWFYDRKFSGGGCVIDLGIHLVDLALWTLDSDVVEVSSRLYAQGRPLPAGSDTVEDYAVARLVTAGGASVQIACSWKAHAGRDAVIEARFHGTRGGAAFLNVNGSFYDFIAERYRGIATERLAEPPDDWGRRAILDWTQRLRRGARFDPEAERLIALAEVLDRIYAS